MARAADPRAPDRRRVDVDPTRRDDETIGIEVAPRASETDADLDDSIAVDRTRRLRSLGRGRCRRRRCRRGSRDRACELLVGRTHPEGATVWSAPRSLAREEAGRCGEVSEVESTIGDVDRGRRAGARRSRRAVRRWPCWSMRCGRSRRGSAAWSRRSTTSSPRPGSRPRPSTGTSRARTTCSSSRPRGNTGARCAPRAENRPADARADAHRRLDPGCRRPGCDARRHPADPAVVAPDGTPRSSDFPREVADNQAMVMAPLEQEIRVEVDAGRSSSPDPGADARIVFSAATDLLRRSLLAGHAAAAAPTSSASSTSRIGAWACTVDERSHQCRALDLTGRTRSPGSRPRARGATGA